MINPKAGHADPSRVTAAAHRHFNAPEWRLSVHILSGPTDAARLSADSRRRGHFAVLVAGGDGTINQVATQLAHGECQMGIIPCGTGNGLARALGIPLDPEKACQALASPRTLRIDTGSVNGAHQFVNVCGAGIDADIAHRANRSRWLGGISGFLRYLVAGAISAAAFKPSNMVIKADGKVYRGMELAAIVANSEQYGLNTVIAPGADVSDGYFDLVLVPAQTYLQLIRNVLNLLRRRAMEGSRYLRARNIDISAEGRVIPIHVDGEPCGTTPLKIRMARGALKVMLPKA